MPDATYQKLEHANLKAAGIIKKSKAMRTAVETNIDQVQAKRKTFGVGREDRAGSVDVFKSVWMAA